MVSEGIREMIDAGISLCGGCGESSDPEQQLHPACACTEPTPPQPIPVVSGIVPEQGQPSEEGLGAALLQLFSAFWISPPSSLVSIEIKSKCL